VSTDGTAHTDDAPAELGPSPEELRPLPDGGLGTAMPDWLRRPPAWRDLKPRDGARGRDLPDPDISVIDPRTFVDLADLPPWLQAIAARGEHAEDAIAPPPEGPVSTGEPNAVPEPADEPRQVPFVAEQKAPEALDFSTPSPAVPWWQSGIVLLTLTNQLVVAVILIVLLATGAV
jgi:hypothetical protein